MDQQGQDRVTICGREGMTLSGSAAKHHFTQRRKEGKGAKKEGGILISFAPLRATDAFKLGCVAGAGGEFARVFGAAAGALVRGAAAWSGVWTTALVSHLGR